MVFHTPPSLVEYNGKRFLIFDAPSDGNLPMYLKVFKQYNVTDVVRVCEPTYSPEPLQRSGIRVWDWCFADGDAPPAQVVSDWLSLIEARLLQNKDACVGVHCVAGLGRAPVLVAVALMEEGMSAEDAVQFIRKHRRGAINSRQIKFLQKYRPISSRKTPCCTIM